MDPDLLPSLVSYYQASQCTKEIGLKIDIRKHIRNNTSLREKYDKAVAVQQDLRKQIEELKLALSKETAVSGVRQREIEALRSRHQDTDKADKAITGTLKIQADSYKREIREIREDLKLRDEELIDLRQDAIERDNDIKEARELTRARDKEIKEVRDQLRAKESENRRANYALEKLQADSHRFEADAQEAQDALEATKEVLADVTRNVKTKPISKASEVLPDVRIVKAKPRPQEETSEVTRESPRKEVKAKKLKEIHINEPMTDYTEPPTKPIRAGKENIKRKHKSDLPLSSPPESPKRKPAKSDFSMTPFIDKKKQLAVVPLSPPTSLSVPLNDKKKKKRKLLGGMKTLMDDTPKKTVSKASKTNFGKELSPLKRPKSSAGLILNSIV